MIHEKIAQLSSGRAVLKKRGEEKAIRTADYDKAMALTLVKLKNGESLSIEAYDIQKPPATIMEKIAKGVCWLQKLEMDKADAMYKAALTNMNALTTEINALQSLLRWMDEK